MQTIWPLLGFLVAPLSSEAQPNPVDAEAVHRLEDELSTALVERDIDALDRFFHPDLVFIARSGRHFNKQERLAEAKSSVLRDGEKNENEAVDVLVTGDVAIVTVISAWTMPTEASPVVSRWSALHVWVRDSAGWQLRAAQVTSISN